MDYLPELVRTYGALDGTQPHSAPNAVAGPDSWRSLQALTPARIAMGRTGGSQRTASLLDFRLAHARARDAVHAPFDQDLILRQLADAGFDSFCCTTRVTDKLDYLLHPENGRHLSDASDEALRRQAPLWGVRDVAIVISDGLSATAAHAHAVNAARLLRNELGPHYTLYPVFVVPFGRVKIGDAISDIIKAREVIILLGERPGLGSPDSLSAYFTYNARNSTVESDRNCVSNIRPLGCPLLPATRKLAILMNQSFARGISGTGLKDCVTAEQLSRPVPHLLPGTWQD